MFSCQHYEIPKSTFFLQDISGDLVLYLYLYLILLYWVLAFMAGFYKRYCWKLEAWSIPMQEVFADANQDLSSVEWEKKD